MNLRNIMLFLFSLVISVAMPSTTANGQDLLSEEVLLQLVEDRALARDSVEHLHSLSNVTRMEYGQCEALYARTKAKYEAWAAAVTSAIEKDSLRKLRNNKPFKTSCREARQAGDALVKFVETLRLRQDREQSSVGFPMLAESSARSSASGKLSRISDLFELLGKVAGIVEEARKKHHEANIAKAEQEKAWLEVRQKIAESFAAKAKWPTWNEIVVSFKTYAAVKSLD